jgi:hypothetical protein
MMEQPATPVDPLDGPWDESINSPNSIHPTQFTQLNSPNSIHPTQFTQLIDPMHPQGDRPREP